MDWLIDEARWREPGALARSNGAGPRGFSFRVGVRVRSRRLPARRERAPSSGCRSADGIVLVGMAGEHQLYDLALARGPTSETRRRRVSLNQPSARPPGR